ncbi:MAG: glutamine--fructose-6-phosphate transaminase (isomerizing) [bacterium]
MCGIFAYIGNKEAAPLLLEGLKKLEYRGYDSAGIATLKGNQLEVLKCVGKITNLEELLAKSPIQGSIGIAHTRWATHGKPSKENAHPHTDSKKTVAIVHNGIIENYTHIKKELIEKGHKFLSETDTEVIAHLIEEYINLGLERSVMAALQRIEGSYAIAAISEAEPDKIVAARKGSPLIIGLGDKENFISSDIPALVKHTRKIIMLSDEEVAVVTAKDYEIKNLSGKIVKKEVHEVKWDAAAAEKDGYEHFMLKEIHEQPAAVHATLTDRVKVDSSEINLEGLNLTEEEIKGIKRIVLTACGTSWHACLVGEYLFEQFVAIPSEVEYAAEFRYRHPVIANDTLVIAITQSGETADTLGAVWEAKSRGAKVIAICNVQGSSIAREADGTIYTEAGPEIGVASTKAFTTQLTVLYLMAIYFGKICGKLSDDSVKKHVHDLLEIPAKLEVVLQTEDDVEKLAQKYYKANNMLYLGRGKGFPVALEGALKLKEVSYVHAEGYPAAEMKHGPIALIDKKMPVIILTLKGRRYEKILGNIEEVKARGGIVIAVACEGDLEIAEKADEIIFIPHTTEALSPILAIVPLQLFAYYIALKRGCHVDQPRNLAKSVTVE